MADTPIKPETSPSEPPLDAETREQLRQQAAKDALQRSFEHGAPETGPGDDLNIETSE